MPISINDNESPNNGIILACDYKHRLLFFDLQYLHSHQQLLQKLLIYRPVWYPKTIALLKKAQIFYQQTAQQLEQSDSYSNETFIQINNQLESYLASTCSTRRQLYHLLIAIMTDRQSTQILECLEAIDDTLDEVISYTNDFGEDPCSDEFELYDKQARIEVTRQHYLQLLTELRMTIHSKRSIVALFTINLDKAINQQGRIDRLRQWLHYLQNQPLPSSHTLHDVLAIKQLLYDTKSQFALQHYQSHWQSAAERNLQIWLNGQFTEDELMAELQTFEHQLAQEIALAEAPLQDYTWPLALLSSGYRLWGQCFHRQFAQSLIPMLQEIAHEQDIDLSLRADYQRGFTELTSMSLLGLDMLGSRYLGVSYSILQSLSNSLISDVAGLLDVAYSLGITDTQLLKNLPAMKWLTGLALHVLLASAYLPLQPSLLASLAIGYLGGSLSQRLCVTLLTKSTSVRTSFSFSHLLLQYVAYGGGAYIGQQLFQQAASLLQTPPNDDLLASTRLCQQYPKQCRQAALLQLELPETETDWTIIRKQWRMLAKTHHPDIMQTAISQGFFKQASQAKQRLWELEQNTSNALCLR